MKSIVAGHVAVTATDYLELSLGTPLDLWLGPEGEESPEEYAARRDAARDILAEEPDLLDRVSQVAAEAIETFAPGLFGVVPLRPTTPRPARRSRRRAAA